MIVVRRISQATTVFPAEWYGVTSDGQYLDIAWECLDGQGGRLLIGLGKTLDEATRATNVRSASVEIRVTAAANVYGPDLTYQGLIALTRDYLLLPMECAVFALADFEGAWRE